MPKRDSVPTLESDDDDEPTPRRNKQSLPPFVILKRGLAILSGLVGIGVGIAMFLPEQNPPTENEQIAIWAFAGTCIAVACWLWGGRDPNA